MFIYLSNKKKLYLGRIFNHVPGALFTVQPIDRIFDHVPKALVHRERKIKILSPSLLDSRRRPLQETTQYGECWVGCDLFPDRGGQITRFEYEYYLYNPPQRNICDRERIGKKILSLNVFYEKVNIDTHYEDYYFQLFEYQGKDQKDNKFLNFSATQIVCKKNTMNDTHRKYNILYIQEYFITNKTDRSTVL